MDKIEKVKKILYKHWHIVVADVPLERFTDTTLDKLTEEICQLFEPKPDQSRLLTPEELNVALKYPKLLNTHPYNDLPASHQERIQRAIKAQRDLTAEIKDAELCEVLNEKSNEYCNQIIALKEELQAKCQVGKAALIEEIDRLIIGIDGCEFEERLDGDKGCIVLDMNQNQWEALKVKATQKEKKDD